MATSAGRDEHLPFIHTASAHHGTPSRPSSHRLATPHYKLRLTVLIIVTGLISYSIGYLLAHHRIATSLALQALSDEQPTTAATATAATTAPDSLYDHLFDFTEDDDASMTTNLDYDTAADTDFTPQYYTPFDDSRHLNSATYNASSSIGRWYTVNSHNAVLEWSDEQICSAQYITHHCCTGNFGTSVLQVLATVKTAIALNRTLVLDIPEGRAGELEAMFIDWQLPNMTYMINRAERAGCGLAWQRDQTTYQWFNYAWKLAGALKDTDNAVCEKYAMTEPVQPFPQSDERHGHCCSDEWERGGEWWYYQWRCNDWFLHAKQVIKMHLNDVYTFLHLLDYNPHYQSSKLASTYGYELNTVMHKQLWHTIVVPSQGVQRIVNEYIADVSRTEAKSVQHYGEGWDIVCHFRTNRKQQIEDLQQPIIDNLLNLTQRYNYNPPAPFVMLVVSATVPGADQCQYLIGNFSDKLQNATLSDTMGVYKANSIPAASDLVHCHFFDGYKHITKHGLPQQLGMHVNYQPHDWGVQPSWAALVNVFLARNVRHYLHGIEVSAYAGMLRVEAEMEMIGEKGRLNSHDLFWNW